MGKFCSLLGRFRGQRGDTPIHECDPMGLCSPRVNDPIGEAVTDCSTCEAFTTRRPITECFHLGEMIRSTKNEICGAKGETARISKCAIHGECTPSRYCHAQTVKTCTGCKEHLGFFDGPPALVKPFEAEPHRHLIYHIWPKKGSAWRWNVAELLKRIELFDGTITIGIVTSDDADLAEEVVEAFAGYRVDNWIIHKNDPRLGEGITFLPMLESLPRDGITFYAHAKGVKHDSPDAIKRWVSLMLWACLDRFDEARQALDRAPMAGAFINPTSYGSQPNFRWHYSGTFFWMRNDAVFIRPKWKKLDRRYGCVEVWPAQMFRQDEVACLFGAKINGTSLYHDDTMTRWEDVRRSMSDPASPSISIVVPTLGRKSLTRMLDRLLCQTSDRDEILVVADGDEARERCRPDLPRVRYVTHSDPNSAVGNAQRGYGQTVAKGEWIWFVDDDDLPTEDALYLIRKRIQATQRPTIFRINYHGGIIWNQPVLRVANVSSQSLVVPNRPDVPRFPAVTKYEADFDWISDVARTLGVDWCEDVIYTLDEHLRGALAA